MFTGDDITDSLKKDTEMLYRMINIFRIIEEHQPVSLKALTTVTGLSVSKVRYGCLLLRFGGFIKPTQKGFILKHNILDDMNELKKDIKEIKKEVDNISKEIDMCYVGYGEIVVE